MSCPLLEEHCLILAPAALEKFVLSYTSVLGFFQGLISYWIVSGCKAFHKEKKWPIQNLLEVN